jgi:molybdenum-dependent DNA-binding transcriptional regulator ModE
MSEVLEMSIKELERIKILNRAVEGKITQILAAKQLKISDRQVRNLLARLKNGGDKALISKKRGRPSNRHLPAELKHKALKIIRNEYNDFSPTLACEYLRTRHNLVMSRETLRQWMIQANLWIPNQQERNKHLPRERRSAFGEMIQIDGSHHAWFEDRGPSCVLMVYIDDATSEITSLHFSESEDLEAYYGGLKKHVMNYGIPLSLYGDRCSVLTPREKTPTGRTQFKRALEELGCELILAQSPQAKGRVERANRTLQDRLVKMLRINGVSTIEEGNRLLEGYRKRHNELFSKRTSEQVDAHRPLGGIDLNQVLSKLEIRTLDKNFVVQFRNTFFQIYSQGGDVRLFKGAKVEIRELSDGSRYASISGKKVLLRSLNEAYVPELDEKQVIDWKPKREHLVANTHPYKINKFRQTRNAGLMSKVV